ncbi:Regulatory-associated protein of TOR 1 [Acorus calamus]|uniref:Regulatory-associated protein of TOR 1 n=1 Tax=Acorus calamus TaxID=4465 RepID=A0AAV9EJM5_ACOCL|nr:Regulatory-associated protein of TOR 1 [Acorus calamus]
MTRGTLLNSFSNHEVSDKGISKLCLVNELDDSLLLVASSNGNIRIWKNYSIKRKQKLVTAFSSIQDHEHGVQIVNAVVDGRDGAAYASGGMSSIRLWDLEKEQKVVLYLHYQKVEFPHWPHNQTVERVVGVGFQPGLDPSKIVSASQAGDIRFLDIRNESKTYLTIDTHRGSLTALAIHRHAPVIASGSAKKIVKVFSLQGGRPSVTIQRTGPVSCLTFHPYRIQLAVGADDAHVSFFSDDTPHSR